MTKSGSKYELRNLLEHMEQNKYSPRTKEPLTRTDITPDVVLQREIFKKVSGIENTKEVLEKILL